MPKVLIDYAKKEMEQTRQPSMENLSFEQEKK